MKRLGYGAMQLAGPGVFGPPRDRDAALAVLRAAVAQGVDHIDTSDFYGPHVTNALIREALAPYPDDLTIATKIGARRGEDGAWLPAFGADELARAIDDNLRNLELDAIDVVNLRIMFAEGPAEGSIAEPLHVLADLQRQGLVRHIGLSNVTPAQVTEGRGIAEIVCVQSLASAPRPSAGTPTSCVASHCRGDTIVITDLLSLAADQNQIVGIRIQPGIDRRFHVHIWVGPRLGERAEWFNEFPAGTDQMAAIDQVAASAIAYCRRPVDSNKTAGAFTWGSRATADESMSAL